MTDTTTPAPADTPDPATPAATTPESGPATARQKSENPVGRIALVAAGLIAISAVGVSVYNSQQASDVAAPAELAANDTPPSVNQVIADLEAKLQDDPDSVEGWRMLGWSYFETGRFAESATAIRRAITLDEDVAEYHSMLGEALVMAGNDPKISPDARKAFGRALQLDPKDARARYFIAATKDIDGNHQAAVDDWFALLADTPADAPYAQDIRDVIRNVGKERGLKVEERLATAKFAAADSALRTDGPLVAAAAIPGPSREQMQAATTMPKGQQDAMVQGMVDGLAAKLKADPDNADGWIMLMRSQMQLGAQNKAGQALKDASAAFQGKNELRRIREAAASLGVPGA